jgi:hypothetical protein
VKAIKRKTYCRECGMSHDAIQQEMLEAALQYPGCTSFERGPDGRLRPCLDWPGLDSSAGTA